MISWVSNMLLFPLRFFSFLKPLHAAEQFRDLGKQGRRPEPDGVGHRRPPRPDTGFRGAQGVGAPPFPPKHDPPPPREMARKPRLSADHDATADPRASGNP